MSQRDAQKSEIHEATEDATTSPGNPANVPSVISGPGAGNTGAAGNPAPGRGGRADWPAADRSGGQGGPPDLSSAAPANPPASNFERGAADRDIELTAEPLGTTPRDPYPGQIGGGPGAGDASSGGGAGAGIPGGGTDMRTDGRFAGGDADEDRLKLFPGSGQGSAAGSGAGSDAGRPKGELAGTRIVSDESDFGGPIQIEDPKIADPKPQRPLGEVQPPSGA